MKPYLLFLSILLFFLSCSKEEPNSKISKEYFQGNWVGDSGQFSINNDGSTTPIMTTLRFKSNKTYIIESPSLPFNIALFNFPNLPGEWDLELAKNRIKLFSRLPNQTIETFVYFWEIEEWTKNSFRVNVLDKDNVFIHEKEFFREE